MMPALPPLPKPGQHSYWQGLPGAAFGYVLAQTAASTEQVIFVLCKDSAQVHRLARELSFFLTDPALPCCVFPDRETLPYDRFSPHQDILSERIATLARLPHMQRGIVLAAVNSVIVRLPPVGHIQVQSMPLARGQKLPGEALRQQLQSIGYRCVDCVYEHGDFAIRGAIIDLFPMGAEHPVRIEMFDDEIDTLRLFDIASQRSTGVIERFELLPARECPLDRAAIARFREQWENHIGVNPRHVPLYQDVMQGLHSAGLESYLPLFFAETATFFDYLPARCIIFHDHELPQLLTQVWHDIEQRHEDLRHDHERPLLDPATLYLRDSEIFSKIKPHARIRCNGPADVDAQDFGYLPPPTLPAPAHQPQALAALQTYVQQAGQRRILLTAETAGRREALREQLAQTTLAVRLCEDWPSFLAGSDALMLTIAPLDAGMCGTDIEIIAEAQLFGQRVMQRRRRQVQQGFQEDMALRSLAELQIGAPVVHIEHGVGRYLGLVSLAVEGQMQEFVQLEYADQARLYVPVAQMQLIARYVGAHDTQIPLHRLGSDQWQKARRQAAEKIHDVAAELLDVYARRAARPGYSYRLRDIDYDSFAAEFPFEETADQAQAITATLADMAQERPMDRLVCGDVGFGKTEVAMRAAFVAVQNDRQVAVLVPTTLLAQQHYESFRDRFAAWPVHIEVISRFRSATEIKGILADLASGKVDILIGTHKLLQSNVVFRQLGLMVVDEEHRFGVKHKEALKQRRADVDMLTLTATPIPRTLNMALASLRDLSIISTPPARRLAIKTFVRAQQKSVIKEAVLRELLRGGQVYYLHNEVESIERCAQELGSELAEARIGIAHGQMRERELEQVMQQFYHKQFNVLVCTTIIETGIDVPSANTIIIERADKLGLAQLHQLRGRVGRSHHQAYAYLLTPPDKKAMTADAEKRLQAIELAQDLGAGFILASQDLEIRGAGELLGDEQSGGIQSLGYSMYMEMLDRAVHAIRNGHSVPGDEPLALHADIQLRLPALIPDDYLADVQMRLVFYKRLAHTTNAEELQELRTEMIDRFGLLPSAAQNLFAVHALRQQAERLGIVHIDAHPEGGRLDFSPQTSIAPQKLIALIQKQARTYKLDGPMRLRFFHARLESAERLRFIEHLLQALS